MMARHNTLPRCLFAITLLGGMALSAHPAFANPESVTFRSALVWRSDGAGDYPLPHIAAGAAYTLPTSVATNGLITSITATWVSEGIVNLEVSADGGLHFTPVVYGSPLVSGFRPGNRLRWRATVGPGSRLTEVRVAYTDTSGVVGTFGQPKLSGFRFRKPIVVNGISSGDLFNYQMPLVIAESEGAAARYDVQCEGHLRRDFADIRFTAADGQTLLPYYLEGLSGTSPDQVAMVWVKIPHLPPQGVRLYVYYGHPTAGDLSDGRAVFDFFEDFDGSRLDPAAWKVSVEGEGSAAIAGSQVKLASASILSKTFQVADGIVEFAATTHTLQDDARLIIRSDQKGLGPDATSQVAHASAHAGAQHCLAVGSIVKVNDPKPIAAGTRYAYRVIARGTKLTFERYGEGEAEPQATVTFEDTGGLTAGSVGLRSDGVASYDWIRVRKDAPSTPWVDLASGEVVEEQVDLPAFANTALLPDGRLTLAEGASNGAYHSARIPSPFKARILVPQWEGEAVSLNISTNDGLSYLIGSVPGLHYYASKKDFEAGSRLRFQVVMARARPHSSPAVESVTLDYERGDLFLVSPNGGERWAGGSMQEIVWTAREYERSYPLTLDYSLDGGKTYQPITRMTDNDGKRLWTIPEGLMSEKALVRISDYYDPTISDRSDRVFAIIPPTAGAKEVGAVTAEPSVTPTATPEEKAAVPEELAELLNELSSDAGAQPCELLIKITDSAHPDPDKDALAYRAGDIVVARPAGGEWSETEKTSFLIIQATLTPQAVERLMSPLEVATGQTDEQGQPIMRTLGRRKYHIDMSAFDLTPKPQDHGEPPVLRHFRESHELPAMLEQRREAEPEAKPEVKLGAQPEVKTPAEPEVKKEASAAKATAEVPHGAP